MSGPTRTVDEAVEPTRQLERFAAHHRTRAATGRGTQKVGHHARSTSSGRGARRRLPPPRRRVRRRRPRERRAPSDGSSAVRLRPAGHGAHLRAELRRGRLVAAMYERCSTNAGYETDVKLVDTRDVYIDDVPGRASTSSPSTSAASSTTSTPRPTAPTPSRSPPATPRRRSRPASRSSTSRASPCSTPRRPPTPTPSSSPRTTPTPRASPSSPTSRASPSTLAAAPGLRGPRRLRGRPVRRATASTSPRCCRSATPAPQTYQSVIDGESAARRDQHHRRHARASQGLVLLEDDKQHPAGAEPRPRGQQRLPRRPPRRGRPRSTS